ncbi:S41 family peptidase [Chitinophaga sp. 30R24]|uniref:S41 family peptidase n=1 Tax=Chitinophaga sp. 30R24 TaxID=3248838 RepID=UPI003B8F7230
MYKKLFSAGTKAMLAGSFCTGILMSCHKDNGATPSGGNGGDTAQVTAAMKEDSLKYLMYQIMQVTYGDGGRTAKSGLPTYYWYDKVPQLNPLSSQFGTADALLTQMKTYAINPATQQPYDHYSFLDRDGTITNKLMNGVSARNFAAVTGDVGMEIAPVLAATNSSNVRWFVLYADKNSPAGKAGIQRGWEITSVNGTTNFTNTQASLNFVSNAVLQSSSVALGLTQADGTTKSTITLNTASYNINPVLFDSVYTVKNSDQNTVKVGYFVFYTFSSVYNDQGQPTFTKTILDQTLSKFAGQGIKNLIVDLRYNGGGATTTAEYLDSAIAPSKAAGKVMYNYLYNDKITQNLAATGLTSQVLFPSSTGGMQLDNVFFIVSGNTASASELTLNNLKPYMNVRLIGDTTYGKPVGFIDFNISMYSNGKPSIYLADLYAINFETKNANNQGGYFTGIPQDPGAFANDYVNVPWGNTTADQNLQQAFNFIMKGQYLGLNPSARMSAVNNDNLRMPIPGVKTLQNNFNGMVDYRLSKEVSRLR